MKTRSITDIDFRKVDKESRTVEFVASDSSVDSYGTVLPVDKWDLSRFEKNGVIGYQHHVTDSADPDDIIGKGTAFVEDGQLIVRIEFEPAEINEKADKVFRKIQFGSVRSVSVGFIADSGHWGDRTRGEQSDVYYYDGMTLMEVSVVNIPANANAVKRAFDEEMATLPEKPVEAPAEAPEEPAEAPIEAPVEEKKSEDSSGLADEIDICLTLAEAELALAEN